MQISKVWVSAFGEFSLEEQWTMTIAWYLVKAGRGAVWVIMDIQTLTQAGLEQRVAEARADSPHC